MTMAPTHAVGETDGHIIVFVSAATLFAVFGFSPFLQNVLLVLVIVLDK